MSKRPRRNHSPAFKAKVALAPVRAKRRWRIWRSSLTFIPIRTRSGGASFSKGLPGFSDPKDAASLKNRSM